MEYAELKGMGHWQQSDLLLLQPLDQYFMNRKTFKVDPEYRDMYLMNIWLCMKFLEDK